jgi:hypothetical protein
MLYVLDWVVFARTHTSISVTLVCDRVMDEEAAPLVMETHEPPLTRYARLYTNGWVGSAVGVMVMLVREEVAVYWKMLLPNAGDRD